MTQRVHHYRRFVLWDVVVDVNHVSLGAKAELCFERLQTTQPDRRRGLKKSSGKKTEGLYGAKVARRERLNVDDVLWLHKDRLKENTEAR